MAFEADPNPMLGHVAETTLVSAALVLPAFWDAVDRLPEPDDFENGNLAALWGAVLAAKKRGRVTRQAVIMQLREAQYAEKDCFTVLDYVRRDFLTVGDAKDSARFMLDRRLKNQIGTLCAETINELATTASIRELTERHERAVSDLALNHESATGWAPAFASDVSFDILKPHDHTSRIPTGWPPVDAKIRGWPRRKMTLIAARPSMGKSLLGVCGARNLADRGHGVAFISMEMHKDEIWLRMACDIAYRGFGSPEYETIKAGEATDAQMRAMEAALELVRELPIAIDDRSRIKVVEMHRWLRRMDRHYREHGNQLDAVFVDYLQLARPEKDRKGNKVQEVTDVSNDLSAMAKDLDICLIALSQLSRETEKRTTPRPMLSDLRESGALEQDADMVGMLFRPAYYFERKAKEEDLSQDDLAEARAKKNILEIDWQKNRNGKTGITSVFCAVGSNAIRDLAPAYRSAAA